MGSKAVGILSLFTMVAVVLSCGTRSFSTKSELWAYLKQHKNGYHLEKTVNGIDFALTYKPTDLLVEQELGSNPTEKDVKRLRQKYGQHLYFNLSISSKGHELLSHKAANQAEFGALVGQLSFQMGEKVHLISQKRDTLQLLDYAYPRLYGLSKSTDMLLVYEKNSQSLQQDYLLLTIEDLGFETGEVFFKVDTEKIRRQPKLVLKKELKNLENGKQVTDRKESATHKKDVQI